MGANLRGTVQDREEDTTCPAPEKLGEREDGDRRLCGFAVRHAHSVGITALQGNGRGGKRASSSGFGVAFRISGEEDKWLKGRSK